jgi:hypothetical protein
MSLVLQYGGDCHGRFPRIEMRAGVTVGWRLSERGACAQWRGGCNF